MRNLDLEVEMQLVCNHIWPFLKSKNEIPKILSKQGGSSGSYRPSEHTVYFRWNVWNKMDVAGKRLLAIHELYHATGSNHNGAKMFCHGIDILSIEIYKKIYGEDEYYRRMIDEIRKII